MIILAIILTAVGFTVLVFMEKWCLLIISELSDGLNRGRSSALAGLIVFPIAYVGGVYETFRYVICYNEDKGKKRTPKGKKQKRG